MQFAVIFDRTLIVWRRILTANVWQLLFRSIIFLNLKKKKKEGKKGSSVSGSVISVRKAGVEVMWELVEVSKTLPTTIIAITNGAYLM